MNPTNYFSTATNKYITENQSFNQVYNIGMVERSSDVINQLLSGDQISQGQADYTYSWFLTLNHMSPNEVSGLRMDSGKYGISVVVKEPGASRKPHTYINPLSILGGGDSGQLNGMSSDGSAYAHMINSLQETPTIMGTFTPEASKTNSEIPNVSPDQRNRNFPMPGAYGLPNGMTPDQFLINFGQERGFKVSDIDTPKVHYANSLHYKGLAVDFRSRDHTIEQVENFVREARMAGINVLIEDSRIPGSKIYSDTTGKNIHLELGPRANLTLLHKYIAQRYDTNPSDGSKVATKDNGQNYLGQRITTGTLAYDVSTIKSLANSFGFFGGK